MLEHDDIVDRLFSVLKGWFRGDYDKLVARLLVAYVSLVTEGNLTAVRILSASRNDFNANEIRPLPERVLTEQTRSSSKESSLVVSSSKASYRILSVSGSVSGCKMLFRRSLDPIGVKVSLSRPNKQSLDFGFCRF
jgi:hypothetical protein